MNPRDNDPAEKSEGEEVFCVVIEEGISGARPEGKSIKELALAIEDFRYIMVMDYQGESLVWVDYAVVGFPKQHSPYLSRADGAKWVCNLVTDSARIKEGRG